jgi:RecB family exonuclease
MTQPEIYLSNSEMSTFTRCRRKWYLGSYLGLRPKMRSYTGPLALGSRVHAALEAYYTDGRDPVEVNHELAHVDRLKLLDEGRDIFELDNEADLGRIMLEGYMSWLADTGADSDIEVIGAEQTVTADILDGDVRLIGKLDMRIRRLTDGVRMFVDFKTVGGGFGEFAKFAQMDPQQLYYHLLETLQPGTDGTDERTDGGMYRLLKKVKRTASARPPFYEQIEVRHNAISVRNMWFRVHGAASDILHVKRQLDLGAQHHVVAYPTPNRDCSWSCAFFQVCPMMDDGSAAEQFFEDFFERGNSLERYGVDLISVTEGGKTA